MTVHMAAHGHESTPALSNHYQEGRVTSLAFLGSIGVAGIVNLVSPLSMPLKNYATVSWLPAEYKRFLGQRQWTVYYLQY